MASLRFVLIGLAMMLGMMMPAHANSSPGVSLLFEKVENGVAHFGLRIHVGKGRATFWRANLESDWDRKQNKWVKHEVRTLLDWSGSTGIDPTKVIIDWPYVQPVRGERSTWEGYNEEVVLIGKVPLTALTANLKVKVTYSDCRKLTDCNRKTQHASLTIPNAVKTDLATWHNEIPKKQDVCGMRAIYEESPDPTASNIWYGRVVMKGSENCMGGYILALVEDGRAAADFEKGTVRYDHSFNLDEEQHRELGLIGQYVTVTFNGSTRVEGKTYNRADIYQYRFRIEAGRLKPGTRL